MTTFALVTWPLLILVLARRLPLPHVILVCLIGGYLFLPTRGGWDLPLLPPVDKQSVPAFTALLLALLMYRPPPKAGSALPDPVTLERPGWIPRSPAGIIPLALIVIGTLFTVATNTDLLVYGPRTVPGLRAYDAFSIIMLSFVVLIPLFLGRKFFAHPDRHRLLLHALVIAGLVYSFLALYEVRMSPQLNRMVYGYFPHSWLQHIRGDGWRPLVFLWHGLALGIFLSITVLAAFGSSRFAPASRRTFYLLAGGWLFVTLFLSNSLGALIIALLVLPVIFMFGARGHLLVAAAIAGLALSYPVLRSIDIFPTDRLVSMAAVISEPRAESLGFRFEQEDALLDHARERPLAGWGTFGRHRIYDARGRDITVTDSMWISVFTKSGWMGYMSDFGFLTLPLFMLALRARRTRIEPETAILALVLSANLIDLLVNSTSSPITWLLAGALLGRLEFRRIDVTEPAEAARDGPRGAGYARPMSALSHASEPHAARGREGEAPVYSRQTRKHRRSQTSGERQHG